MVRMLVRLLIAFLGNAIGLIVAAVVVDGVHINVTSFIIAVVIFTILMAVLTPFLAAQLRRRGSGALGGVALISTFVALVITDVLSDGLSISGITSWLAATVIVWAGSLLAVFILPYLGLRKYLSEQRA
jgi:uncharacterized membrane protein YvlD (DUF360 family)